MNNRLDGTRTQFRDHLGTSLMPELPMHKAVILARGLGTRMQRADATASLDREQATVASTGVKALMPLTSTGRPFLDYVLSALASTGYRRVCLVVGPEHDTVRRYYRDEAPPTRLEIEWAVQPEPKGTADAVSAAKRFAADDPFLTINSDNYYPQAALAGLRQQDGPAVALFDHQSMLDGNVPAARLRQFAVARIDAQGCLREILEKPDERTVAAMPRPLWIGMNCWRFDRTIFEACRRVAPSPRGELELTDAVRSLLDARDRPFRVVPIREPVLDLTGRADVAAVDARLQNVEVLY